MTLYLKYRSKNLDELDLPEVSESLKKIVSSGVIPHAFLFAGPKGTGKTSAARILAKIVNCESKNPPCDKCEQCVSINKGVNLDVIEMDAASHRGIDDVRSLRDAVKLAPTRAKMKIYIIDEAHMLTTEASNALLKTLEEPPPHVIFILATTNPEKLIDTIRSRTTTINFRKANVPEIIRSLKRVVKAEKISITDKNLVRIAELSEGAFRNAIKILEQFTSEGESFLDKFKSSELTGFIDALIKKDDKRAIKEVENNIEQGVSTEVFLQELLSIFHKAVLSEIGIGENQIEGLNKQDLIKLTDLFTQANKLLVDSPIEQLPVEIAVIKWCGSEGKKQEVKDKVEPSPTKETATMVNDDIWKKILAEIHPVNISIEGLLRASKPIGYDGKTLTLGVFYKFHKERLEDANHRKILETILEKVLNNPTRIACVLVEPEPKKIIEETKVTNILTESKDQDIIKAAEEIFGN